MRALGLDIGEKRIGVAVSDPTGTIASPLRVLDAAPVMGDGAPLNRLIDEYEAELIVVGLPRSLDGSEGPQAARIRSAVSRLSKFVATPIVFCDERLSSSEASRVMGAAGLTERDKRGNLDMVAAAIFLQSYLDAHRDKAAEQDPAR